MRNKILTFLSMIILCAFLFIPVSAEEIQSVQTAGTENISAGGWVKNKKGAYQWRYADGTYLKKAGWVTLDGKRYYLNADGTRKKGLVTIKKKLYYLHPCVTYGVVTVKGKTYYFDEKTGAARKGWQVINGKKCYMKKDGSMAKNQWVKDKYYYYLDKDGALVTGPKWLKVNGSKYYIGKTGRRLTGIRTIKGKKYYFDKNGKLVTNKTAIKIGGKYYRVSAKGVLKVTDDIKTKCSIATQQFIQQHTSSQMTNSQKFRTCFNYIIGYTHFQPWKNPSSEDFKNGTWPYKMAIDMLENNVSGSCYGIASLIASCAKELGYEPYVIAAAEDHAFVMINGLYYDNMGPLFGASSHSAYHLAYKVKF